MSASGQVARHVLDHVAGFGPLQTYLDAMLPDGSRLHVVNPDTTAGPALGDWGSAAGWDVRLFLLEVGASQSAADQEHA